MTHQHAPVPGIVQPGSQHRHTRAAAPGNTLQARARAGMLCGPSTTTAPPKQARLDQGVRGCSSRGRAARPRPTRAVARGQSAHRVQPVRHLPLHVLAGGHGLVGKHHGAHAHAALRADAGQVALCGSRVSGSWAGSVSVFRRGGREQPVAAQTGSQQGTHGMWLWQQVQEEGAWLQGGRAGGRGLRCMRLYSGTRGHSP
jgi:hypothetical protein